METAIASTATLDALTHDLEDLWRRLDAILDRLGPKDWSRKHGKDWVFADLPYHLAYVDRDVIARAIERGADMPAGEREILRTRAELNAWNARKFAERPAGQTVQESLAQMRAAREAIRRSLAGLGDSDLDRPVWCPFPGTGWLTVRRVLELCSFHTWNHFMELRLRLKCTEPEPGVVQTHSALSFMVNFLPMTLNRAQAANARFTAVMEITGRGGGAWSIHVADGACYVMQGRAPQADLVLTQSVETLHATSIGALNPMLGMLTGKIKLRGLRHMATFGKLFPPPKPDTVFESAGDDTIALSGRYSR